MKADLAEELIARFARAAHKYHALEQTPLETKNGVVVFGAEMHLAAAVGEGEAPTATELARRFGITKGAVSQAVQKLEAKGFVERRSRSGNNKTKYLYLTIAGRGLVRLRERLHGMSSSLFEKMLSRYTVERLLDIKEFLKDVETLIDGLGRSIDVAGLSVKDDQGMKS
jgi:DNA-binding MarR family transcriptional regulator